MNESVTFAPARHSDPARSARDAALPWADWPVVTRARDVMTLDPDRVAGSDTLMDVAGMMRSLLAAFLPVCDEHGDLQGIIALRDLHRVLCPGQPTAAATASSLAREPAVTIGVNDPVDHVWPDGRAADVAAAGTGRAPPGRSHPLHTQAGRRNLSVCGPRSHRTLTAP